jgi:hypothetical protein
MERGQDRDEPKWVSMYMCVEAMLGISLYSCLYLKLAKLLCLSYYLLFFLFNKIPERKGRTGSALGGGWSGVVAQTMYTHVNKCINDKIKERKTLLEALFFIFLIFKLNHIFFENLL